MTAETEPSSVTRAFVDTSVLTNALLKTGPDADSARQAIAQYSPTSLPVYAIKEFRLGPLSYCLWLHNQLATHRTVSGTLEALARMQLTPRRYLPATATRMLADAIKSLAPVKAVESKYGRETSEDSLLAERCRLSVGSRLRRAWLSRRTVTTTVSNELPCFTEPETLTQDRHGLFVTTGADCHPQAECCLRAQLAEKQADVAKVRDALQDLQSTRPEDVKRLKVLRDFLKKPNAVLEHSACRRLGDAYFALFCPEGAAILTTNDRDHRPLAASLGKSVQRPVG